MNRFSAKRDSWPLRVVVDVGAAIGFGHLKRCTAIALKAQQVGARVHFDLGGDLTAGRKLVLALGFDCQKGLEKNQAGAIILVDRTHSDVIRKPAALMADIGRWRGQGARVVVIDAAGSDSLRYQLPNLEADLFVAPYAGERKEKNENLPLLAGPEFAPLGADYENLAPAKIRTQGERILVSCGGSDPFEITGMIMQGLALIEGHRLIIRVVLGPGFEPAYRARLVELGRNSKHAFEPIDAPDTLASHMRWSDLAVATSGLTKYELAAVGTPAILISPDYIHARANEPFAALGTAVDLGSVGDLTPAHIAAAVSTLLDDSRLRSAMARAGQGAVDGRGAARIASALRELAYAEV